MSAAVISRSGRAVPYALLGILAGAGLCGVLWFMTAQPLLFGRILSTTMAIGCMGLVVSYNLVKQKNKTVLDLLLTGMSLFIALNMVICSPLLLSLSGKYVSYDCYYNSTFWTSTMLTHAVQAVLISICLIIGATTETLDSLRREAQTDPLSGLLNSAWFRGKGFAARSHAKTSGAPLCIILADLDHFKRVNDRHGHAVGDAVIVASPGCSANTARLVVVGRTGGEEFAMLLPSRDISVVRLFAKPAGGRQPGKSSGHTRNRRHDLRQLRRRRPACGRGSFRPVPQGRRGAL